MPASRCLQEVVYIAYQHAQGQWEGQVMMRKDLRIEKHELRAEGCGGDWVGVGEPSGPRTVCAKALGWEEPIKGWRRDDEERQPSALQWVI